MSQDQFGGGDSSPADINLSQIYIGIDYKLLNIHYDKWSSGHFVSVFSPQPPLFMQMDIVLFTSP